MVDVIIVRCPGAGCDWFVEWMITNDAMDLSLAAYRAHWKTKHVVVPDPVVEKVNNER